LVGILGIRFYMTDQREKFIVEANFRVHDEQEWDWLAEAFGATYCESEAEAMAIARFLAAHPKVAMVEVLHQPNGRSLESIWCSDPKALQAAKERLIRISEAIRNMGGLDGPSTFSDWLVFEQPEPEED
jgi:hypothetical protein